MTTQEYEEDERRKRERDRAGTLAVWFFALILFMFGFIVGHIVQIHC